MFLYTHQIMGVSFEALEIILEVQMKRSHEKITRKKSFPTYKTLFFRPFLLSNLITFLFLKRFEVL
jgi:hypothetical protein